MQNIFYVIKPPFCLKTMTFAHKRASSNKFSNNISNMSARKSLNIHLKIKFCFVVEILNRNVLVCKTRGY